MAILRYKEASNEDPAEEESKDRQGLTLNPWNEEMSDLNIPFFVMNSTGINHELCNHPGLFAAPWIWSHETTRPFSLWTIFCNA